ncbi:MAG TPA: class I SAM-dependent methyltransferase [Acidimicrobiia bacterium]|nr:class I SAM-dependent methyltransferase [Acidimicrobiia bacterium]
MTNIESWDRIAARQSNGDPQTDTVIYGPDGPAERELRLIGDVKGKRVLELGCGTGQAAVTLAKQGATVIAVDASTVQLAHARRLMERAEVRIEWHETDLADLAFLRGDSIDVALSVFTIGEVDDVNRLFRQVHRVLRPAGAFVFCYEHPMSPVWSDDSSRSYFDESPVTVQRDGEPITLYPRTISEVFTELGRAGFRVEVLIEPPPAPHTLLSVTAPSTIVWRARKEGA